MELRKTLAVWLTVMTAACSCNREAFKPVDNVVFIQDARLEEAGQTLSPGDAFHLHGIGCQQTDNVMLTFTWKTADATIPVGKVSGIYAKKQNVTPVGITAVLPYRYPAADVEVSVMREGKLQRIGLLRITDGQSPKELRLYGVSHVSCKIDGFMLDMNNACQKSLEVALPENLHSVINVPRSYGLCGISGKDEHRTAVCIDFFTGEVKTRAIDVMALFLTPSNAAVAVVCHDGICALQTLPIEIGADYMTKSYALGPVQPTFAMPDGLKPEYFGNYPGVSIGTEESTSYLLSANKGDGNWTAVMLDKEGFHIMEDIAAESLIPFRAGSDAGTYDPKSETWSDVIYMPCLAENGFAPELPKETPDLIYLCFPNNPTGATITKAQLQEWVDYANKVGAVILYDAAYEAYISEPDVPHSIYECEGARTCAIEFRSFSKNAGFTGVRLGFTVIPKDLKSGDVSLHALWARRHGTKYNGAPYIVQRAGEAVYSAAGKAQLKEQVAYYMNNAQYILKGLQEAGFTVSGGVNAPYIWLKAPNGMTSWEFFDYLLENVNVVGTPGSGFGPSGEHYFRLTAFGSYENTVEAVDRLKKIQL